MPQTTFRTEMTDLANSMNSRRARKARTISGTLTMGFNKARSKKRLRLIKPQISLLYLPLLQVL
jgi:hypothetical protein